MTDVVEAFKYGQLTSMMMPGHILVDFVRESRERGMRALSEMIRKNNEEIEI
jgi:hypothetical protein